MATLIGLCLNPVCKSIFASDNYIHAVSGAQVTIKNCRVGPCPYCSSAGKVIDGTYTPIDGIMVMVTGTQESMDTYNQLLQLLKSFKEKRPTKKEAIQAIEEISPETAKVFRAALLSGVIKDWPLLLIALLTFMMEVHQNYFAEDVSEAAKDKLIQYLEQDKKRLESENATLKKETAAKHVDRFANVAPNDKCPCKSKKRFKNCHGMRKSKKK